MTLRNTKLPIETGRWFNIPRENRICKLCNSSDIGDEFHYLFKCTDVSIKNSRVMYLSKYFFLNPNILKFEMLFNVTNTYQLCKICKLLNIILRELALLVDITLLSFLHACNISCSLYCIYLLFTVLSVMRIKFKFFNMTFL